MGSRTLFRQVEDKISSFRGRGLGRVRGGGASEVSSYPAAGVVS